MSQTKRKSGASGGVGKGAGRALALLGLLALAAALALAVLRRDDWVVSQCYFAPWPVPAQAAPPPTARLVAFHSADGTGLSGWFVPGGEGSGSKPLVLYLHGNAGNLDDQWGQFSFLPRWGYDTFALDYRGFGYSLGSPSRTGLLEDCQAALAQARSLDPGKPCAVVGFSMGAAYALMLAARQGGISAVAALAPFTDFRSIGVWNLEKMGFPGWAAPCLGWLLVPRGLEPIRSALSRGPEDRGLPPLLVVQGAADGTIPLWMGEKIAGSWKGPKSLLVMPGYGHGDYFKGPRAGEFRGALESLLSKTPYYMEREIPSRG